MLNCEQVGDRVAYALVYDARKGVEAIERLIVRRSLTHLSKPRTKTLAERNRAVAVGLKVDADIETQRRIIQIFDSRFGDSSFCFLKILRVFDRLKKAKRTYKYALKVAHRCAVRVRSLYDAKREFVGEFERAHMLKRKLCIKRCYIVAVKQSESMRLACRLIKLKKTGID